LKLPAGCRESSILREGLYPDRPLAPQQTTGNSLAPGFTLIEIIVAISIIAVLIAIAVPGYSRYRDKAKLTSSISLLASIRTDLEVYREKREAYPDSINFADFTDQDGKKVVTSLSNESLHAKMHSWESYIAGKDTFTITCRAIDAAHTVLMLNQTGLVP
jgi:prepilin-type N-terminal cleavage/methylation domain-containing protein